MARNIEKEQERIRTGNRFVKEPQGSTGVFPRDIDVLYVQYANLRYRIFNDYRSLYADYATQEELRSYIDEEFIKLSKEYEINGEIDFPYYIKTKLDSRVRGTFNEGTMRTRKREPLGTKADDVEHYVEGQHPKLSEAEYRKLVQDIAEGVTFTPLERDVYQRMVMGEWTVKAIIEENRKKHNVSQRKVQEAINNVKELIRQKLDYNT